MSKVLICLGGGLEAVPIIERAKALGCMVVVVDIDGRCPARYISDIYVQESCYHSTQAIETLHEIATEADGMYDGVLCCAVDAPLVAAEIAAEFGLPGLSVEAAKLGQDKWVQILALLDNGFYRLPSSYLANGHNLPDNDGRWVIKPLDSRGGRGVVRLLPGVDPAFAYEIAKANSPTGRVIVEEWLDGPQLSTESVVQDGKVLFTAIGLRNYDRLAEFAPYVIENGAAMPYGDDVLKTEIDSVIKAACRALGWDNLSVKGDLVVHDGKVYVIELACRLSGGFFSSHYIPLSSGVDFIGMAIKMALGEKVEKPTENIHSHVCQLYAFPKRSDVGKIVKALPFQAFEHNGLFETFNLHPGKVIETVTSHPQRWGQALATGRTPDEARARAEQAVSAMKAGVILE